MVYIQCSGTSNEGSGFKKYADYVNKLRQNIGLEI